MRVHEAVVSGVFCAKIKVYTDGGAREHYTIIVILLGKPSKEKTGNILVFYQSGVPPPP